MRVRVSFATVLALGFFVGEACAQVTLQDDCTPPSGACQVFRDCTQSLPPIQSFDCNRCLVQNVFSGCMVRGSDPVCEARKSALRAQAEAERSIQQAKCEASKIAEMRACQAALEKQVLSCEAARFPPSNSGETTSRDLLLVAETRPKKPIPDEIKSSAAVAALSEDGYSPVDSILVVGTEIGDHVPSYSNDGEIGFTVGDYVFVKDLDAIDLLPVRFWLRQIETARLFTDYGVENFLDVYEKNPTIFNDLIDGKVDKLCNLHSC